MNVKGGAGQFVPRHGFETPRAERTILIVLGFWKLRARAGKKATTMTQEQQSREVRKEIHQLLDSFVSRGFNRFAIFAALQGVALADVERYGDDGPVLLHLLADALKEVKDEHGKSSSTTIQ